MRVKKVNNYIDILHFRTYNHVVNKVMEKFPEVNKKQLKQIVDSRLKDHFVKLRKIEPYYIKIFSTTPNCWFHDLMDNSRGSDIYPRFWHIFIGTNNHFAVALPLKDKRATSIRETLTEFINKYHPNKLTSDEEQGFVEKNNLKLLSVNHLIVQIITDQNHSSLGIIDRFIRTLRDMNIPTEKGEKQSIDAKYKWFSIKRMNKLIDIYNSTFHSRINCSPKEMFDNPELENSKIVKI